MLVIKRKIDQAIAIGEDVCVVVLAIEGNEVKLGIDAPRNIAVRRPEAGEEIDHAAGS